MATPSLDDARDLPYAAERDFPRLVAGLRRPEAYPPGLIDAEGTIEHLETHISHVFLAGDRAYKLKKPVNLGFLDFSTAERRLEFCREELRLNHRLAPELYLGLVAVTGSPDRPRLGGDGPVLEYLVEMRRFDQRDRLDHRVLTPALIDRLAARLAAFHDDLPPAAADSPYGTPEAVLAPMLENFRQIRARSLGAECQAGLDRLEDWTRARWRELTPVIEQRRAAGRVRECHGDLHRGNIALVKGEPLFFDALEFAPQLRWIDTASELAFLLMDLEEAGEGSLARRLLNAYLEQSGDYGALQVLDLYQVYRALVRAKVLAIRLGQGELSPEEDAADHQACAGYLALAASYTRRRERQPRLLLTSGLSGSGKSWLASRLREALPLIHLRSDIERKRLFGFAPEERTGSPTDGGIYTPDASGRTYDRLRELAAMILGCGYDVLVDATFLRRDQRRVFRELAAAQGAGFALLVMKAPIEVLRERVASRQATGADASEAGLAVLERQLRTQEALEAEEMPQALIVDATAPPALEELMAAVAELTGVGLND